MDKVRVALGYLRKYHFWVLAGLVVLIAPPLWWKGTSTLAADFETNRSKIDGSYKKVEGIPPTNPNGKFKAAVDERHEELKKATQAAWQQQYDLQTPIFVWPNLPGDFRNKVSQLAPTDEIPSTLRREYQNNIAAHVPLIWERCRVRRVDPKKAQKLAAESEAAAAESERPTGARPNMAANAAASPSDVMTGVVVWPGRVRLDAQAASMRNYTPSTQEIRLFQEDLWIHEVVLKIIDQVNANSTEPYNARIKEILDLQIGAAVPPIVAATAEQLISGEVTGAPAAGGGGMMRSPYGGGGRFGKGVGGGEEDPAADPAAEGTAPSDAGSGLDANRYVDKDGAPQPAGSADTHSNGVFRLIPVEMRLMMEEAAVPDLLAACANSPIPVEVRKVTIRSQSGAQLAAATPGGGMGGGGMMRSPRGGFPPGGGKGGGGAIFGGKGGGESMGDTGDMGAAGPFARTPLGGGGGAVAATGEEKAEIAPTDVEVYVRMHIKIFNRPDPEKLGIVESTGEGESTAEAEAPPKAEPAAEGATEATDGATEAATDAVGEAPANEAPAADAPAPAAPAESADPAPTEGASETPAEGAGDAPAEAPPAEAPPAEPAPAEEAPSSEGDAPPPAEPAPSPMTS